MIKVIFLIFSFLFAIYVLYNEAKGESHSLKYYAVMILIGIGILTMGYKLKIFKDLKNLIPEKPIVYIEDKTK